MNITEILALVIIILLLVITHRWSYLYGIKKADEIITKHYLKPYKQFVDRVIKRDDKVMKEITSIVSTQDVTQKNIELYYRYRLVKKKTVLLACKYGKTAAMLKQEKENKKLLSPVASIMLWMDALTKTQKEINKIKKGT